MPGDDEEPPENDDIGRWAALALFAIYAALALAVIAPIVFMLLRG